MRAISALMLFLILVLTSCQIGPKPIAYGTDTCHFCKMTIVDKQHAAQFVTEKGKVYKFDAAECMMNQLKDFEADKVAFFLVNDYSTPGELVDAKDATFLISMNIPSPMGAFLTAFESQEIARQMQVENDGELFNWEELQERFHDR